MIYLSRLLLHPRSRQADRDARNPYEMHRTLSRAFNDNREDWQEARCLFRVEEAREREGICVLVQSRVAPDWQRLSLPADYWLQPPCTKAVELKVPAGSRLSFRLRANPTICQNGKRNPVRAETDQMDWLARKGSVHGFRPEIARVTHADVIQFGTAAGRTVTMQAVLYDGVLTVTDAPVFLAALEGGIGSGKGFGFGLLSVARAFV